MGEFIVVALCVVAGVVVVKYLFGNSGRLQRDLWRTFQSEIPYRRMTKVEQTNVTQLSNLAHACRRGHILSVVATLNSIDTEATEGMLVLFWFLSLRRDHTWFALAQAVTWRFLLPAEQQEAFEEHYRAAVVVAGLDAVERHLAEVASLR